ncbi:MAG: hypothetical protein ACHRHE_02250 [Tepidisphaerales bacterium]
MSAVLAEFKIILVLAAVLSVTLATAKWRQAEETPLYLPASDPHMFDRVCASACRGPADEAAKPLDHTSPDPSEEDR